eukprot:jgi/Tetstr1/438528/TSEL_027080.t1
MDAAQGKIADDDYKPSIAYRGDAHLQLSSEDMQCPAVEAGTWRIVQRIAGTSGLSPFVRWLVYISYVDFWPLPIAHALLLGVVKDFWEICSSKMKKMDRRMALVALTSDFGKPTRPMLPSAGTSGVVCAATWTCDDYLHFEETVAVLVLGDMFDNAEHQHLAVTYVAYVAVVIYCLRDCEERAEVEQHDNHVYIGEVMYFLEVTHTSPSVPDLTLNVCRLHAAERMVKGSPLGTGVWQSKAPLQANIQKGHGAFPVALKHIIEEKL